jgi:hypothetical protein
MGEHGLEFGPVEQFECPGGDDHEAALAGNAVRGRLGVVHDRDAQYRVMLHMTQAPAQGVAFRSGRSRHCHSREDETSDYRADQCGGPQGDRESADRPEPFAHRRDAELDYAVRMSVECPHRQDDRQSGEHDGQDGRDCHREPETDRQARCVGAPRRPVDQARREEDQQARVGEQDQRGSHDGSPFR